jgi:hypothetical protein
MKLFIANVGANESDAKRWGLRSPIFPDNTFEFITIKEHSKFASCDTIPCYDDLRSWTGKKTCLGEVLPSKVRKYRTHFDPDFECFTYGDINSSRAANLKAILPGDQIWFLARLWNFDGNGWNGKSGFYFIGYFSVTLNISSSDINSINKWPVDIVSQIASNAHYKRYVFSRDEKDFRIIVGDRNKSKRFSRALPVTPDIVGHIYGGTYDPRTDSYWRGSNQLKNKNNNPRSFTHFGSVTRSIQSFLDSDDIELNEHLTALTIFASQYI